VVVAIVGAGATARSAPKPSSATYLDPSAPPEGK
jgi:hypothetical protein